MKMTKKMKKKLKGMNYATKANFEKGYRPPTFKNVAQFGHSAVFVKTVAGVPYVNPENF